MASSYWTQKPCSGIFPGELIWNIRAAVECYSAEPIPNIDLYGIKMEVEVKWQAVSDNVNEEAVCACPWGRNGKETEM